VSGLISYSHINGGIEDKKRLFARLNALLDIMTLPFQTKIDRLVRCKMGHAEKEKQQDTIDLHLS
jgi:hypothetical protein